MGTAASPPRKQAGTGSGPPRRGADTGCLSGVARPSTPVTATQEHRPGSASWPDFSKEAENLDSRLSYPNFCVFTRIPTVNVV